MTNDNARRDAPAPQQPTGARREVRRARRGGGHAALAGVQAACPSLPKQAARPSAKRHTRRTRVAFFRYSYYDVAFKFFVEQVLDADFVRAARSPRSAPSSWARATPATTVCAPFKHILGDYIEALELGADVLVQFAGPCRLGYYGELQQSIMRDLGYEFDMLNFATLTGKPLTDVHLGMQEEGEPQTCRCRTACVTCWPCSR